MNTPPNLTETPAVELRDRLASGALSATDLAQACIARIHACDPQIEAWAWFDVDHVMRQAAALDTLRDSGGSLGPLHGLPIGLKDIIDTQGIPTENGCPVDAGRVPEEDAVIVERLKSAGALIMGKTVTTELAFLHPSKTKNPRNAAHTPGGSSSGSAAAVAAGMIPLAVGTQTAGSVIRPASFCGITGFKPSFGAIPRQGVLMQSHSLDTLGVFARDPESAALLAEVLMSPLDLQNESKREFLGQMQTAGNTAPKLAFVRPPGWEHADADLKYAFYHFIPKLGNKVFETTLPEVFDDAAEMRARINLAEMAHYYRRYFDTGAQLLGAQTRDAIREGLELPAHAYLEARARQKSMSGALAPLFAEYDAILCPAAPGPAPEGLGFTGNAIFNGLWTMAGTPAITLPLMTATNGLPMGVQLVGPVNEEARLLRTASWLWHKMGARIQ